MPIQPGSRLLHYRIVDKLGEGGMGVVWEAEDTRLDRRVAIKVLPELFATDPEPRLLNAPPSVDEHMRGLTRPDFVKFYEELYDQEYGSKATRSQN